jgi:hypothetical protein
MQKEKYAGIEILAILYIGTEKTVHHIFIDGIPLFQYFFDIEEG